MVTIALRISGANPGVMDALVKGGDVFQHVHRAVGKAMRQEVKPMREAVRRHVGSEMKVVKRSFLHAFRAKVLDQDPKRLPGMWIGSRIPWSGVHETGATINKKMLIPLHGRVGRKRFKAYVDELMRGGNAYFIKKGGKTILMAENIKEHDRPLAGFKRRYRKAEGIKRLKRGADIPIAVLVSKITIRKSLNVERVVRQRIPALERAIQGFL